MINHKKNICKYALIIITLLFTISSKVLAENEQTINKNSQTLFESSDTVSCYRIPSIITLPNGNILAVADERIPSCADLIGNRDINIVLRQSADNGLSWSKIERIVDFHDGESASDASMILDKKTNTVFLFYNYMNHNDPSKKGIFYLHYIKSKDNGSTWSKPIDITDQITKKDWKYDFKFITSGKGTQTEDGTILHTLVNLQKGLFVFGSKDHGKTWFLNETSIKPADESKIIELEDGTLMINSRVNNQSHRHIHLSKDGGKSWNSHSDSTLVDPHCNASIIKSNKDTLYFCNAKSETVRENLYLRKSTDSGATWDKGKQIYAGSSAYSDICECPDTHKIYILFEKDDYSKIEFVTLAP